MTDKQCGTILVVDDNREILALVKTFLEQAGYSVAIAADGNEALRYYQKNQPNVLLLLTDVQMPSMNGFDLIDRVLELDSQLPVLCMSGDAWCSHRGLKCVPKPFCASELLESVNRAISSFEKKVTCIK